MDGNAAMSTQKITELPLHLEPITPDPFLGKEQTRVPTAPVRRELDCRRNDGIEVRLLWREADGQVTVAVHDAKTGEAFEIQVEGREARDAFHHPYAHAAFRGNSRRRVADECRVAGS